VSIGEALQESDATHKIYFLRRIFNAGVLRDTLHRGCLRCMRGLHILQSGDQKTESEKAQGRYDVQAFAHHNHAFIVTRSMSRAASGLPTGSGTRRRRCEIHCKRCPYRVSVVPGVYPSAAVPMSRGRGFLWAQAEKMVSM
jgi:hypothetical protein